MPEKYLVNNVVMRIAQKRHVCGSLYWYGDYYASNGKRRQHYFGKDDPRPNYPRFVEPTGIVWLYGLGRWVSR